MEIFNNFKFFPSLLSRPRAAGISAIMRIKNGEEFLRISVESHLPFVNEIVACYNDCSDNTESILNELALKYPGKVRPIKYLPHVHPILSEEHRNTPTESVHSIANYYNFALSQARFNYALKLDDDHLAINKNFENAVKKVRLAIHFEKKKLFTFSGLNLVRTDKSIGVFRPECLVGSGDHMFFPVCDRIYFRQEPRTEVFHFTSPRFEKEYVGLVYMHLKYCKKNHGLHNLKAADATEFLEKLDLPEISIPFEIFRTKRELRKFIKQINPVEYWLRTNPACQNLIYKITGKHPPLRIARAKNLFADLQHIDFEKEVISIVGH